MTLMMASRTASRMSLRRLQTPSMFKLQQRSHSGPLYKNTTSDDPSAPKAQVPQYEAPSQTASEPPNSHRQFYKSFGFPVLKVALGSLLTYQVIYWSWLKLESLEEDQGRADTESSLKTQLVEAVKERAASK